VNLNLGLRANAHSWPGQNSDGLCIDFLAESRYNVVVSQAVSLDSLPPNCLPRNKQVIEATLELIHDRTPDLPTDLPAATRDLSPRGGLEPPDVQAQQLRDRLGQGTATEEDLAQLYFIL
jgi:hypothetical protein